MQLQLDEVGQKEQIKRGAKEQSLKSWQTYYD